MSSFPLLQTKRQRSWGWATAIDFFFGGVGAGLFLFSFLTSISLGLIMGWLFVVIGLGVLAAEVGTRWNIRRIFSRIASSWLSRGAAINAIFLIFGILCIIMWLVGQVGLGFWFGLIGCIAALLIICYPALLLLQSSVAIPFWGSAVLPLLFLSHSLAGGLSALILLSLFTPIQTTQLIWWQFTLLITTLVLLIIYLMTTSVSRLENRSSLNEVVRGELSRYFLTSLIMGILLPLLLGGLTYLINNTFPALIGSVVTLIGLLLLRYLTLAAGRYVEVHPWR